ncbi:UNVERIFIED_ORG: hypothetical protein ABID75_005953 [Bacillus proteolyticus]
MGQVERELYTLSKKHKVEIKKRRGGLYTTEFRRYMEYCGC